MNSNNMNGASAPPRPEDLRTQIPIYVLNEDHQLVETHSAFEWEQFFSDFSNRRVAITIFGETCVSTVFVGIGTGISGWDKKLFETMVFRGEHGQDLWKWDTWNAAVEGHQHITASLIAEWKNPKNWTKRGKWRGISCV